MGLETGWNCHISLREGSHLLEDRGSSATVSERNAESLYDIQDDVNVAGQDGDEKHVSWWGVQGDSVEKGNVSFFGGKPVFLGLPYTFRAFLMSKPCNVSGLNSRCLNPKNKANRVGCQTISRILKQSELLNFPQCLISSIQNHLFDFCNCVFIMKIFSCLFSVSDKAERTEVDPLLESQSDGGTLLGSSQISAPEDYWFFANRVIMWCGRSIDYRLVAWHTCIAWFIA